MPQTIACLFFIGLLSLFSLRAAPARAAETVPPVVAAAGPESKPASVSAEGNTPAVGAMNVAVPGEQPAALQEGWALYLQKGDTVGAEKLFAQAAEKAPSTFVILSSLSQMQMQQSKDAEAVRTLTRALREAPWDEYGEPAVRDLLAVLSAAAERGEIAAALQKRLGNPQLSWLERDALRILQFRLLAMDGAATEFRKLRDGMGYVPQWRLIGPFSNRNREGFERKQAIESSFPQIDFAKKWRGRGREIGWFEQAVPDGLLSALNLDRICYPGSESLSYACVFVECNEEMAAALAINQSGASALWLNGDKIYSDGIYCRGADEAAGTQRLIGVRLRKGVNQIVCKIGGDLKCPASLALRVVPLAAAELGKPGSAALVDRRLDMLTFSAEPQTQVAFLAQKNAVAPAASADTPTKPMELAEVLKVKSEAAVIKPAQAGFREVSGDPGILYGALAVFADRAQVGAAAPAKLLTEDPLAVLNVAYLMRDRGLSDADFSRHREYYSALAQAYPACPLFLISEAFSQPDENLSRTLLQKAVAISPRESAAADSLLELALRGGFYEQALADAKKQIAVKPTYRSLNVLASALLRLGFREEATGTLRQALTYRPGSGDPAVALSRELQADNEKLALLEENCKAVADTGNRAALAALYYDLRRYADARKEYLRLAVERTYSEYFWDAAAATLVAQDDYAPAAQMIEEGLKAMPQSPVLLEKAGRLWLLAGKREEGLRYLQRSLEVKKDNPQLQAYLKALLPKQAAFYERVEVPLEELAALPAASEQYPDFDTVILLDQAFLRVNRNGTARRMYRSVVKVLRQRAAADAAQMEVGYSPGSQRAEIVRAVVLQPDGSQVENAQIDDYQYGQNGQASMMYGSGGRVKHVSLPQVKEGSIVDFQWTVEDSGEQLYHNEFCDTYFFGGMEPALRFRYTLEYPEDTQLCFAVANADYQPQKSVKDGVACLDWVVKDVPGIRAEDGMPPYSEIKAQLGVATFRNDKQLGEWAWNLFSPQMELSAEMKTKVAELTASAKTREEKIKAIYDFVVDEIRYVSISFGRFGCVPHKVERTYRSRYGDCKDTAVLFVALLKEAGVPANPVLVRTRYRGADPLGLPSSDNYDHSIAYVPADQPGGKHYWLDGTVDYHPFGMIPFLDRGTRALVFGVGTGEEIVIDPATPEQNLDASEMTVTLAPGGEGELAFRMTERGEVAMDYMSLLEKPDSLKYMLTSVAQERYPGSTVEAVECSKPGKVEQAVLSFKIRSQTLARRLAGEYRLKTTFFPLDLSGLVSLPERHYDLVLGLPRAVSKTVHVQLPAGATFQSVPAELELQTPAASFVRKAKMTDGRLEMSIVFTAKTERVKAADYAEFKKFCNAVGAAMEEMIVYAEAAGAGKSVGGNGAEKSPAAAAKDAAAVGKPSGEDATKKPAGAEKIEKKVEEKAGEADAGKEESE